MKHKHAELIKAWADGAEIEVLMDNKWESDSIAPRWLSHWEYRIKPKPIADIKEFLYWSMNDLEWKLRSKIAPDATNIIKVIRYGETGDFKSVTLWKDEWK